MVANAEESQEAPNVAPDISTRDEVALCLSGGGYRAALFHLGALRRLDELGVLPRITTVSSVSGGSIVSAFLATRLDPWPLAARDANFGHFARDVRKLTKRNIRWIPSFRWIERAYRAEIGDLRLGDLPRGGPRFVFCATDLNNGVNWTFARDGQGPGGWKAGSWRAGYAPADDVHLARAVAASSAFPPVLGPVSLPIDGSAYKRGSKGITSLLRLTDGGVYDNLALEPVWKRSKSVLVSDGGATLEPTPYTPWMPWRRLSRYMGVANGQGGSIRKRWLIAGYTRNRRDEQRYEGAYFGIGSRLSGYAKRPDPVYPHDLIDEQISEIRTDLDAFSDDEAAILQNAGYIVCDAGVRTWCPGLAEADPPPPKPPYPDLIPAGAARKAIEDRKSIKRKLPLGRFR